MSNLHTLHAPDFRYQGIHALLVFPRTYATCPATFYYLAVWLTSPSGSISPNHRDLTVSWSSPF